MKYSIATSSISGELDDKLIAISKAGFDGIELYEDDLIMFSEPTSKLAENLSDIGLKIDAFHPGYDVDQLIRSECSRSIERLERTFHLMEQLGANLLLLSLSETIYSDGDIERITDKIRAFGESAAKQNIKIGIEHNPLDLSNSMFEQTIEIIRLIDRPNVGFVLDAFNISNSISDMNLISSISAEKIFHVQLSDAPIHQNAQKQNSHTYRLMPGEGDLPLAAFMRAVIQIGYPGPIGLEVTNDAFRGAMPRLVANDGYRSLVHLMDLVRYKLPSNTLGLPEIPPRCAVEEIAFLEFAANGKDATVLAKLFDTLGFEVVGKHLSKSVTLWQQGNIRLVINTEKTGYSHSAYLLHGLCVCDMGLMVGDASAAFQRAKELNANIYEQNVGENELSIPAIRGVGGSVIHLLDRRSALSNVWNKEFSQADGANIKGTGLTAIDHIGQTMQHEEFHSWSLFFLFLFDLVKTPLVSVKDPRGSVISRAIESHDRSFRLTMNGINSHKTFAGRFLLDSAGSAFQHIAFTTENIFETAKLIQDRGFKVLQHSENYYSNLISRFNLDEKFVSKLAELNIMYDRDDKGEYFQVYGTPIGDGFFFEIVERKNGYGSYGGSNASYRTAALKKAGRHEAMPKR